MDEAILANMTGTFRHKPMQGLTDSAAHGSGVDAHAREGWMVHKGGRFHPLQRGGRAAVGAHPRARPTKADNPARSRARRLLRPGTGALRAAQGQSRSSTLTPAKIRTQPTRFLLRRASAADSPNQMAFQPSNPPS
jgi:hypothetical protein